MPPRESLNSKFWSSGSPNDDTIGDDAMMENIEDEGVPVGNPPRRGARNENAERVDGEEDMSDTDSIMTLDELEYPRNCLTMLNLPREATCKEVFKFLDVPRSNIITLFIHTPKEDVSIRWLWLH